MQVLHCIALHCFVLYLLYHAPTPLYRNGILQKLGHSTIPTAQCHLKLLLSSPPLPPTSSPPLLKPQSPTIAFELLGTESHWLGCSCCSCYAHYLWTIQYVQERRGSFQQGRECSLWQFLSQHLGNLFGLGRLFLLLRLWG